MTKYTVEYDFADTKDNRRIAMSLKFFSTKAEAEEFATTQSEAVVSEWVRISEAKGYMITVIKEHLYYEDGVLEGMSEDKVREIYEATLDWIG